MSVVRAGSSAGSGHASLSNAAPPRPSAAASGMPWTLPLGVVCGVLRSPWASIQSTAPGPPAAAASPPSVPSAIEWSPPSTIGIRPSPSASPTRRATRSQVLRIAVRKRARGSPLAVASATAVATLPQSAQSTPSEVRRSSRPA